MATVAELQSRLESLKKARDSGVLIVRHQDTSTTYRSINAMKAIIADLEREIAGANNVQRRGLRKSYQPTKGL